ncbi:hypothetical protein P255_02965 [Acinetobacter brisouii CIP 110357]|uniref:Restriction alleviation protein, Lar family n=1 Tax=Acinetobacter brisouii CIP 110357 TaxID=1341683 RepID=V2TZT0_9GAMM|nr:hypothetical protein [Acinetobacter brisouii]ENV46202.1 hypothetical protein F954_02837 [Acinetobacter brisouii ANC 4119]ESK47483.1 hypothetical protein P255_02965 [Acinetobacter brisouii CIP 110357]
MKGNRWHEDQNNNMQPDIKSAPCPWCGLNSVVVDTILLKGEHLNTWTAQASCHECGTKAPDTDFAAWDDHQLCEDYLLTDWENEREVVNLAVKIWNKRKTPNGTGL